MPIVSAKTCFFSRLEKDRLSVKSLYCFFCDVQREYAGSATGQDNPNYSYPYLWDKDPFDVKKNISFKYTNFPSSNLTFIIAA